MGPVSGYGGVAHDRRSARLRHRRPGVELLQPLRHRLAPAHHSRWCAGGGGRQRPPADGGERGRSRPVARSHGLLSGRRLPARAQADGDVVPEGTWPCPRGAGRRAHDRDGDAPSRHRTRGPRLASHGCRNLVAYDCRGSGRLVGARGPVALSARGLRPAPGGKGLLQPRCAAGVARLLRAHVGALCDVGVVRRLLLPGGRAPTASRTAPRPTPPSPSSG